MFWIRLNPNAHPDPGFYLNANPDSGSELRNTVKLKIKKSFGIFTIFFCFSTFFNNE